MRHLKICIVSVLSIFVCCTFYKCKNTDHKKFNTEVTLDGTQWYFNGRVINPGSPAEGLLMNVRMVNTVFEDRGMELDKLTSGFDPAVNTQSFIGEIPEYVASGVNAFTISLQGGLPGYEGAINTAFNPDGSIREDYMQRVETVIRACDANNAAVILTLFYQRQHSHNSALTGRESIRNALKNTVQWISEKSFTNVLLEVSNEYRHGGYRNWPDGEWLISEAGQIELMQLAKQLNPELLASTSGMGTGVFHNELAREADFLLIHFNNTSLEDYTDKINNLKRYGKPIVCNEDDKIKQEGAIALAFSVLNSTGWGYMNSEVNQHFPFKFSGPHDDTAVYRMFRNVATPGYKIDSESLKKTTVTITYPNDGDIFQIGHTLHIKASHLYPDKSIPFISIKLLANNKQVASFDKSLQASWTLVTPGVFILEAVVNDLEGKELYRSPQVDFIVQPN